MKKPLIANFKTAIYLRLLLLYRKSRFYYRAYQRLELMNKAASLSFYTFISVFPLLLVLIASTQFFIATDVLVHEVNRFLQEALPYQSELIIDNIKLLFRGKRVTVGWWGALSLLISSQLLYVNLEKIINSILHIEKRRHFLKTRLLFLVWLISMVFSLFVPFLIEFVIVGLSSLGFHIPWIARFINQGAFIFIAYCMFCLVMMILPTRRLKMEKVFKAAAIFSIVFYLGKTIFRAVTLMSFDRYNFVYGSLSTLVLGALWIFYFYNIFLFCVYWVGREHDPIYIERNH